METEKCTSSSNKQARAEGGCARVHLGNLDPQPQKLTPPPVKKITPPPNNVERTKVKNQLKQIGVPHVLMYKEVLTSKVKVS